MAISDSILSEFDLEMARTRRTLERVPTERFDWKPHERSMSMGGLATHLSNLPSWTSYTLEHESLDLAPGGEPLPTATIPESAAELLEAFDNNVATARAAICADDRSGIREDVAAAAQWDHAAYLAKGSCAARLRSKPQHSSPRTTRRLSPAQ